MKTLIFVGLALIPFFSGGFASAEPVPRNPAAIGKPRFTNPKWRIRHQKILNQARTGRHDVVFLGDSITEGWIYTKAWAKYFKGLQSLNAGIGGDRTDHLLWRLENGLYEALDPKVVVLMIGTNNATVHRAQDIALAIKLITDQIMHHWPKAQILLLGLTPGGQHPHQVRRKEHDKINRLIAPLGQNPRITYLDTKELFVHQKTGVITKDVMWDYLHLTKKSYERWGQVIQPRVKDLLGTRSKGL